MIVHLVGSVHDIDEDVKYLREVIESVHDRGGVLAHNWLEHEIIRKRDNIQTSNWKPYVDANLDAVKRADVVIIDATHYAFTQGFLLAAALERKKPVLLLSRHAMEGYLISGITNPLVTNKIYTSSKGLKEAVNSFISKNTVHTKDLRFNMFLTRPTLKYLEDTTRETGKSRSEIIRELIKRKAREEYHG